MRKQLRAVLRVWVPKRIRTALRHPRRLVSQVADNGILMVEIANAKLRGRRATHVVITGPSRAGKTTLRSLLSTLSITRLHSPSDESGALATIGRRADCFLTDSCFDVMKLEEIEEKLSGARDLQFCISVRDPRALIATKKDHIPHQYHQGFDYQLFGPNFGNNSFSNIGVVEILCSAKRLLSGKHARCSIVRYEDLVTDPEQVVLRVASETGLLPSGRMSDTDGAKLRDLIKRLKIDDSEVDDWLRPEHRERVLRQLHLCPELEELAVELGYPPASDYGIDLSAPPPPVKDGTIIAFHTDDDVYRAEAERFTRRLDELGLKYDITVVPPRGEWVENCAMKPEFILEARKRLRGPLLYLDVDAYVHSDPWPYLSLYDGDMAAYVHTNGNLASGTLLLKDNASAVSLLQDWVAIQKQQPKEWDQRVLQEIIEKDETSGEPSYKFQRLPPNMTYIFDQSFCYLSGGPIIEHLQASRVTTFGQDEGRQRRLTRIAELEGELK